MQPTQNTEIFDASLALISEIWKLDETSLYILT